MPSFSRLLLPPAGTSYHFEPPVRCKTTAADFADYTALSEAYVRATWPGKPVGSEAAWEYVVEVAAPDSSIVLATAPDGVDPHGAPLLLAYFMSNNNDMITGVDMTPLVGDLTNQDNLHSPTQPWATGKFGLPGIAPPGPVRGGERFFRIGMIEIQLPRGHGWGYLETTTYGQYLRDPNAASTYLLGPGDPGLPVVPPGGYFDAAGNEVTWGTPPWGNSEFHGVWPHVLPFVTGNGPWFDGDPPTRRDGPGWLSGLIHHEITDVRVSLSGGGIIDVFYGIESRTYTEPALLGEPWAVAPDLGASSVITTDGYGHQLHVNRDQHNYEVTPLDGSGYVAVPPEVDTVRTVLSFWGWSQALDGLSAFDVRSRFFPVAAVPGVSGSPPWPYRDPSINAGQGPAHAVPLSVR